MSVLTGGFGEQVAAYTYLTSKKDINITMPEGEYPLNVAISGTWENKAYTTDTKYIDLSLTDSDGNIACDLGRISLSGRQRRTGEILYENVSGLTLTGKKLYIKASGSGLYDIGLYGYASVVIETAKKEYNITLSAGTGGSLTADKATATKGEQVTLTPTPATGYRFKSYSISPNTISITADKFTMPAADVTVTATFEKIIYTITVNSGSGSPGGTVTADKVLATMGEEVTLTVSPGTGVQLSGFTKVPSNLSISNNKFTMPAANVTITANWSWIQRTVTVGAGTGGSLTANKATAHYGEQVKLTPTPETGYRFKNYTTVPANLEITDNKFTMPNSNVTVTANFEKIRYSITVNSGSGSPGGTVTANKTTATMGETVVLTVTPNTGVQLKSFTKVPSNLSISSYQFTMPAANVTITAVWEWIQRTITLSAGAGGSLTASKLTAHYGEQITLTPSPNTGYQFSSYTRTPGTLAISANKFTMPNSNVTIAASFSKVNYTIYRKTLPSGAGTVITGANTANYQDQVTVNQTPNEGYYFNGWTITPSGVTVSGGKIVMPAANVTITANYLKRSTGALSNTIMSGGDTVTLTISPDKATYKHKYKLSFGTGMETSLTTVAAGTTSVNISIPENWSDQIPNAVQKTGGTLTLETYNGSTKIGEYVISSLVYRVPGSAKPSIGTISTSVVRTIDGTTYANVGDYYIQNKSGVRIQTTASGARSSTIASLKVEISGYQGNNYTKTVASGSIDFSSKLLMFSGDTTITVTATDSRGRTKTKTKVITVQPYKKPSGSLKVWRVDTNGDQDVMGTYGKYTKTSSYTAIGSNSLTVTLRSQNTNANNPADAGNLLPTNRQTFNVTTEYTIELILTDAFETVTISKKLPTAQFMMYFNKNGDRMSLMKAVDSSLKKNGKNGVIELSGNAQIYVGSNKIEDFISNVIGMKKYSFTCQANTAFDLSLPDGKGMHLITITSGHGNKYAALLVFVGSGVSETAKLMRIDECTSVTITAPQGLRKLTVTVDAAYTLDIADLALYGDYITIE